MPKLTDKQKKQIIADRIEGMSLRALAAKYGVSTYAVRCAIKSDAEITQKITQKKKQNTLDMLAFMDSRKCKAQDLVDRILLTLNDQEKLQTASVRDLATALGIIVDKFTQATPQENAKANTLLEEIKQGIEEGRKYVE